MSIASNLIGRCTIMTSQVTRKFHWCLLSMYLVWTQIWFKSLELYGALKFWTPLTFIVWTKLL